MVKRWSFKRSITRRVKGGVRGGIKGGIRRVVRGGVWGGVRGGVKGGVRWDVRGRARVCKNASMDRNYWWKFKYRYPRRIIKISYKDLHMKGKEED